MGRGGAGNTRGLSEGNRERPEGNTGYSQGSRGYAEGGRVAVAPPGQGIASTMAQPASPSAADAKKATYR